MTSSYGNIFRVTGPLCEGIHRSPVNSPHKSQWRGALMFSLIYAWLNACVNNREAGDLRRYRAHYDITVMHFAFIQSYIVTIHYYLWIHVVIVITVVFSCRSCSVIINITIIITIISPEYMSVILLQWSHMNVMSSQITTNSTVYSTFCSGELQRKGQSSASLALMRGFPSQRVC